jgi:sacsin
MGINGMSNMGFGTTFTLTKYRSTQLEWTSLSASKLSIGLLEGAISVPEIKNVQFLDARWSGYSRKLLSGLQLADCLSTLEVIEKHIIPAWKSGNSSSWGYSCKEQVGALLLQQYSWLIPSSQKALRTLDVVPVARINGERASKFAKPVELIDPSVPGLTDLFLNDEEAVPDQDFFLRFGMALKDCGLKTSLDEALVNLLIHCYANSDHGILEIQKCAHKLLESTCNWASPTGSPALRQLAWIPTVDHDGNLKLMAPEKCRGFRDPLLVSYQLPIFRRPVSVQWEGRLSWRDKLSKSVLFAQLIKGLQHDNRAVIDAVLSYINQEDMIRDFIDDLKELRCILTTSGIFVKPSMVFQPTTSTTIKAGCEKLHPYLGNVDQKFWHDHRDLLIKLRIEKEPSIEDLLSVQDILESKGDLEEADCVVAIEILRLASRFPRASLANLKVLNKEMSLCPLQDISYHDLGHLNTVEKVNLTHPDIPFRTIDALGIELLSERMLKGLLDIADIDDEDEFEQKENVATRIIDTLDRYPVDATFREYLANADDTRSASKVSWLLDGREHPRKLLLTRELGSLQGPALLVHNDGGMYYSMAYRRELTNSTSIQRKRLQWI